MANSGLRLAIDEFRDFTGYDLSKFLIKVNSFFKNNQPNIINWYNGKTDKPDANSFKALFTLLSESSHVLILFDTNKDMMTQRFYFFELLEQLEQIDNGLLTTINLSKLLRSTRSLNSYKSSLEIDYVMNKYDTLESVQDNQISNNNFDNRWWDLAIRNDLSEDQYDNAGGQDLKLPLNFNAGTFLSSIVDNPIGDRMYGRDINRKLTFKSDDIETLGYKETVLQSVDVFFEARIGTIPENPDLGYDENIAVGSNKASIALPILKRQFANLFSTDDSFSKFGIKNINFGQDAMELSFEINTVRGEVINRITKI